MKPHDQPIVSVVIPSYNSARTIKRAIDSVLAQNVPGIEIIVIDDASTDGGMAAAYAPYESVGAVSILRNAANKGPSFSRNRGIATATGRWIALLDADDAWDARRMAEALPHLDAQADLVFDNLAGYDQHLQSGTGPLLPDFGFSQMTVGRLLDYRKLASKFNYGYLKPFMRAEFIRRNALSYDETVRTGEDILLYTEFLLRGARTAMIDKPLYIYTTPVGQASGVASSETKSFPRNEELAGAFERLLEQAGGAASEADRQVMEEYIARIRGEADFAKFYFYLKNAGGLRASLFAARHPAVIARALEIAIGRVLRRSREG